MHMEEIQMLVMHHQETHLDPLAHQTVEAEDHLQETETKKKWTRCRKRHPCTT